MSRWCWLLVLGLIASGCSTSSSDECGGCALPPMCNADGTAPDPYPACACGCVEGEEFPDGRCNGNSCIVPAPADAAVADGPPAADAGRVEAGARDGS